MTFDSYGDLILYAGEEQPLWNYLLHNMTTGQSEYFDTSSLAPIAYTFGKSLSNGYSFYLFGDGINPLTYKPNADGLTIDFIAKTT